VVRALTRRARDDAAHRPGRVGFSRKRERRSKPRRPREINMRLHCDVLADVAVSGIAERGLDKGRGVA
jgi:hypothetical protein